MYIGTFLYLKPDNMSSGLEYLKPSNLLKVALTVYGLFKCPYIFVSLCRRRVGLT